jgi:hypothetical protein
MRHRTKHNSTDTLTGIGIGAVLGVGAMLLFGRGGARQRSWLRDKVERYTRSGAMYGSKLARHARNVTIGSVEEAKARRRDARRQLDEDTLISRVRAQIGKDVQYMKLVTVRVEDGNKVVISGDVLLGEEAKLHDRLPKIRGVHDFRVEVREHSQEELNQISGIQGTSGEAAVQHDPTRNTA